MNSTAYNIDCMLGMKPWPDKYFDLGVADPPYGLGEANGKNHSRGNICKPTKYAKRDWDSFAPNKEYFDELIRISRRQIVFGANHFISKLPYDSSCWIVWDKQNGENDFADAELAWTNYGTAVRVFKYRWAGMFQGNLVNSRDEHLKQKRIHPTEKPIALYSWIYHNYLPQGGKVIDTHLGSGSNRIAAHKAGNIDFTGYEIDTDYFNAQEKRFKQFVSQTVLF